MIKLPTTSSPCVPDGGGSQLGNTLLLNVGSDALQVLASPGLRLLPYLLMGCQRQTRATCIRFYDSQQDQLCLRVAGLGDGMGHRLFGQRRSIKGQQNAFVRCSNLRSARLEPCGHRRDGQGGHSFRRLRPYPLPGDDVTLLFTDSAATRTPSPATATPPWSPDRSPRSV